MKTLFEIYPMKKHILSEEWQVFIKKISEWNGYFQTWKLYIVITNHIFNYYIECNKKIPVSSDKIPSFMLKGTSSLPYPCFQKQKLIIPILDKNIIDIIIDYELKDKGTISTFELSFTKLGKDKIKTKVLFYAERNSITTCYHPILTIPNVLLSVDFTENKNYLCKNVPKYIDTSKILPLLTTKESNSVLRVDTFPYSDNEHYIAIDNFNFAKHSLILGASGCGKSKFISSLIYNIYKNNDLKEKFKIIVIDPHAALKDDIGGIGNVIDFKENNATDLFINDLQDLVASTELLLDLFKSNLEGQYNSKLERLLRHSIYILLANSTFNFQNLKKLLLDIEYRNDLINNIKNVIPSSIIDFFNSDFNELKTRSYNETFSLIIGIVDELELIPAFKDQNQYKTLENIIKDNYLNLFSLNRISLGEKSTKIIAGLLMQQVLILIQKRKISEHIIFIIDEIALIENPILTRFLSEARKYNLSLILAGQYFSQISEKLKNAIFANTINYFIFRISKLDAKTIVDNFNIKIPFDDSKDTKIQLLMELNNRECIARIEANDKVLPAFKAKTIDFKSIPQNKNVIKTNKPTQTSQDAKISNTIRTKTSVNLKDIMQKNSTNKKGTKNE